MAHIIPFKGIRYSQKTSRAAQRGLGGLICPPYDVISDEQRKKFISLSKHNFVNIELPESNKKAKKILNSWLKNRALERDSAPSIYIYRQEFEVKGRTFKRTGIFAALELDESKIHRHEKTIQKHIDRRFELLKE